MPELHTKTPSQTKTKQKKDPLSRDNLVPSLSLPQDRLPLLKSPPSSQQGATLSSWISLQSRGVYCPVANVRLPQEQVNLRERPGDLGKEKQAAALVRGAILSSHTQITC